MEASCGFSRLVWHVQVKWEKNGTFPCDVAREAGAMDFGISFV